MWARTALFCALSYPRGCQFLSARGTNQFPAFKITFLQRHVSLLALLQRVPGSQHDSSQPSTSLKPPEKRLNRVYTCLSSASKDFKLHHYRAGISKRAATRSRVEALPAAHIQLNIDLQPARVPVAVVPPTRSHYPQKPAPRAASRRRIWISK